MTMGLEDDGDPATGLTGAAEDAVEVDMDLEETTEAVVGKPMENPRSTSLQTEAAKSARTTTTATTAGMKKIEEEEEEEEILGMKTRNWKKINLSFAVELIGQEGEDIRGTDYVKEGNNDNKMKHHPIMSKIAHLIVAIEKDCNTVKIMSSKKQMVLDSKVCMDSWSINEVKEMLSYSIVKNRYRNVQVTLHIDYGMTSTLWRMKNKVFETLKSEKLWITNHNGPIDMVVTTQIGFFAGVHPDLYRKGWEENINQRVTDYFDKNKAILISRAQVIPGLKDFVGPLPAIQIIPLNIPGMKTSEGKNQKALSMGVTVPSKFRSLLKYVLQAIGEDMKIEYVDFTMKYDQQKKVLYNKLVRSHHEFMNNHKTVNIHCMERNEMKICCKELMEIPSVIALDETVITERNGTWVLVLKYNNQKGFEQSDLDKIDSIILNNPLLTDRKLRHHPFRKRQPIESLNLTALSGQESRFKDFTATPFSTTDSWSSKLFPPRNITTTPRGGGGGRSNKTAISIDDDTTIATLADTVSNLQRSVERLTTEMASIGNKVAIEATRGDNTTVKIDAIESSQKILSESLIELVNGIKDFKDDTRRESCLLKSTLEDGIDEVKEDSRKEASELKEMMRELMNSNNNNNNNNSSNPQTRQTVNAQVIYGVTSTGAQSTVVNNKITPSTTEIGTGTGTEKRKHDGTTPSSSPDEKEISSPDHRKQRQYNANELEISDPTNGTLPVEIDFGMYMNDTEMGTRKHASKTTARQGEYNNNTSPGVGHINSACSFATDDMFSEGTATVVEEEQSITSHNFNNVIDAMDYTTDLAQPTITTRTNDGFTAVQNGSPNRNSIRERQQARVNNNPYSVLQYAPPKKNTNNNNSSAKDRHDSKND
jgi:hypothetical protein